MNRLFGFIIATILSFSVALAGEDRAIEFSALPKTAQQFVRSHFSAQKVSLVTMERELFSKSYEVIFASGDKVEFEGNGKWKEVDCRTALPSAIIPQGIRRYLSQKYPNTPARKIEKQRRNNYEVKLSNGIELTLTQGGKLLEID